MEQRRELVERGLVRVSLMGSPMHYLHHRSSSRRSKVALDAIHPEQRAQALFPALSSTGWWAPADLEPHLGGGEPISSWSAPQGRDILVGDGAKFVASLDYTKGEFSLHRALDGSVVSAGRIPSTATTFALAPEAPELALGMADGRIIVLHDGLYDAYSESGFPMVANCTGLTECTRVSSSEIRVLRYMGPRRVIVCRGARVSLECIDLEGGRIVATLGPVPGVILTLAATRSEPERAVWVESTACAFAWRPCDSGARGAAAAVPAGPPPLFDGFIDGPFYWNARIARLSCDGDPPSYLRALSGVMSITAVGPRLALVRCRRETFVWDADGNRVASIVRIGEAMHVSPRGIPFLDSSVVLHYVVVGPDGRLLNPCSGRWIEGATDDRSVASRADLFDALAIPAYMRAIVSPSARVIALVCSPRPPGAARGRPRNAGWVRGRLLLPFLNLPPITLTKLPNASAPATQVRFAPDSRALVVPSGSAVNVYLVADA